ncbi:MAG TPA: hypothetical protein VEL76_07655 [Gemmataceae bacterium]|nr:hypothetical protein [Gemmataceae bacterium]
MGFTVIHEGETTEKQWRMYDEVVSRSLLKRGINLDRVPLAPTGAVGGAPLYVWDSEADASAVAQELNEWAIEPTWRVRVVSDQPRLGPFRPLEIRVGKQVTSWNFGLDPLTIVSLRMCYPASCPREGVSVHWRYPPGAPSSLAEVQSLAVQFLPILTGLSEKELHPFWGYQIVDAAPDHLLIGPVPFQPEGPSGLAAEVGPPVLPSSDCKTGSDSQALR